MNNKEMIHDLKVIIYSQPKNGFRINDMILMDTAENQQSYPYFYIDH